MTENYRPKAHQYPATATLSRTADHWLVRGLAGGVFVAALMTISTADANLYKWVDENGNVSYQDHPPPSDFNQSAQVLNTQGVTVKRIPGKAEQRKLEEEKRIKTAQIQRDEMLIKTFPNEEDLTRTRDKRIGHIDGTVTRMYDQLVILNSRLQLIEDKIQDRTKRALEPSDALSSDRAAVIRSIDSTNALIKSKLRERRQIATMFRDDLQRYRELKQATRSAELQE